MVIQIIGMNLGLAAISEGQDLDKVKVSLSLREATLMTILDEIEEKTDFVFAYSTPVQEINQSFTVNYNNTSLKKILSDLATKARVEFKRINNTISVSKFQEYIPPKQMEVPAITVTGQVVDETGAGLPGVNVLEKNTSNGTTTDSDGNFTLNVADQNSVLLFSFIGYKTQEVTVGTQTNISVQMNADITQMQEVVVIGYQTVEKKDITGAVSVVSPSQSNRVSANSIGESIQGLAPGVTVRSSGVPGQTASVQIRGVASFLNTDPLYVIDGMIADANSTINNNDIESIQILKDASAAAIYGARAANGVVIITTKQGREGPAKIGFSAKYGVQQIMKRWDVMNSSQFASMQRMQYENSGQTPPSSVSGEPSVNTDWQDQVLQTGSIQDYNLTISGGSKTGTYLISGSYFNNEGYVIGNSFNRGSLRVNTRSEKGRVTFGENILLSNSNTKNPAEGNPIYDMPQMLPIIPVQSPSYISATNPGGWGIGTYPEAVTYAFNPVAVRNLSRQKSNFAKLVGNAYINVKIFDWLNYKFNAGTEASFDYTQNLREVGVWQYNAAIYPSSINESRSRYLSLLFEHTLNFSKTLGDHAINGVVGISNQHTTRSTTAGGRTNLTTSGGNYFTTISSATGTSVASGQTDNDYRIFGYLGRINYSYKDKYLLTLTGRVDQDSRFGENYRTGFFPSVAASWRISRENFFQADWISDLKINASYGKLGIVITNLGSWPYTSYINNNPRAIFGPDQTPQVGAYQAQLSNPDLHWEERTQQNIGVDASFLDNRISVEANVYNSLSKNAITNPDVPGYLGNLRGNPYVNSASIRNRGIELAVTYRNNQHDLKWDVSGNVTTIKNKVENVNNRSENANFISSGNTRSQVGHAVGQWYVLKTAGIFQTQEEINNYVNAQGKMIQPDAKPGDIKYLDLDGNGQINNEDRTFVKSPWPKVQAGAQFNASFKQFSLNLQFVGVFGYTIYNDVRRILDSYQNTNFRSDISPWSPTNTHTSDPRIGIASGDQGIVMNNFANSDRWLENASYVRLRNVEIGYALPKEMLDKLKFNNARIYVSGQNLFTITGYSGLDPDVTGANIQERGVDNGHWPSPRVFSIGIQGEF
jgi:TonB-linked SusC/RagA family outer membrane protein